MIGGIGKHVVLDTLSPNTSGTYDLRFREFEFRNPAFHQDQCNRALLRRTESFATPGASYDLPPPPALPTQPGPQRLLRSSSVEAPVPSEINSKKTTTHTTGRCRSQQDKEWATQLLPLGVLSQGSERACHTSSEQRSSLLFDAQLLRSWRGNSVIMRKHVPNLLVTKTEASAHSGRAASRPPSRIGPINFCRAAVADFHAAHCLTTLDNFGLLPGRNMLESALFASDRTVFAVKEFGAVRQHFSPNLFRSVVSVLS